MLIVAAIPPHVKDRKGRAYWSIFLWKGRIKIDILPRMQSNDKNLRDTRVARQRVLFLCIHNSCRSQIAEAWARELKPNEVDAYSAGVEPTQIDPRTIATMAEVGINISKQHSKGMDELKGIIFDWVVTLCDEGRERCPVLPGVENLLHVGFDDPAHLAEKAATEEEALAAFRRVRDEIREFVAKMPGVLFDRQSR